MNESIWLPGVVVLVVGFVVGAIAAFRMRRAPADLSAADLELRVTDLAARRDELYDRLRAAVAANDAGETERLETAAARVLRDLDTSSSELSPERVAEVRAAPKRDATAGRGWATRHPLTVGFLFGAGLASLVGVLFYWAVQDAGPRPDAAPAAAPATEVPPHEGATLPPEVAARATELEIAISQAPDDLQARRELALIRLQASQYVEAFQQAQEILEREPRDIDALYVQGVVRMTMGQMGVAKGMFDQVIGLFPGHVRALVARGMIFFQLGDREAAFADWEAGIAASGGSNPQIEALLAQARTAEAAAPPSIPPSTTPATTPAMPASPAATATPAPSPTFGARLELEGAPRQGAVLFVSLRGDAPGPPAAVRRIDAPTFPLEITLDAGDSMLGRPLPESGVLSVRLDADGSASTRDPEDPSAEVPIAAGERVELVLK